MKFKSRGKAYNLPDSATHAAPGAVCGVYFKDGGKWWFTNGDDIQPIYGEWQCRGFYDEDIVKLNRGPRSLWSKIKGVFSK